MKKETLDEFLARGGQIKKVTNIDKPFVDSFLISKPNLNKNKEAYFKYVKRGKELKK
jgi:hypothetical protein